MIDFLSKSYSVFLIVTGIVCFTTACTTQPVSAAFDYDTQSDSARYYFMKGWEEIMDNGRWTESEAAFRKAVEYDPNWVLGKSMVGRITRNLPERQQLLQELESIKDQASKDGRLLVDVNLLSLEAANKRDQGIKNAPEFTKHRRQLAETNFGSFARKYPEDSYFKAEYLELLHANHGAQVALDSLRALASADQMKLGFYISYAAILELELGNIEKATALADALKESIHDPSYTSYLMLQAQIYQAQDSLQKAKAYVDSVVEMDTNHMIALGTQSQISQAMLISNKVVPQEEMERIYQEVKTPFKYGIVFQHPDTSKLIDSPTIFRENNTWYMTYIVFDGQGYESWLAKSDDLLRWESKGRILSFTEDTWDASQKAGYLSLVNIEWGGDYTTEKYQDQYWMTYLGGNAAGYEAGRLKIGLANSPTLTEVDTWKTTGEPILSPDDEEVRWFENKTIYKSLVIRDREKHTGHSFVMYYNAKGDTANYESIGMAVSDDMVAWERYGKDPVITKYKGICGDAQIAKYDDLYIMFYFGAFWKPGAFERFACSYDLINWTDWEGEDLIAPSEPYDKTYAHKPWVIKWKGVVYHFYNAVGESGRVLALATSKDLTK